MRFLRFVQRLSAIGGGIASLSILLMCGLILAEIIGRSILGRSTLVAEEYSAYLLVLFGAMALASTLQAEGHIRVDLVLSKLSKGKRSVVNLVCALIGLAVSLSMSYQVGILVYGSWTSRETSMYSSKTPLWLPQIPLLLGCLLLGLQFLGLIVSQYVSYLETKALAKGP